MVYLKSNNQVALSGLHSTIKSQQSSFADAPAPLANYHPQGPSDDSREISIDDRFSTRLALDSATTTRMGFESLLAANEKAARNAFHTTIRLIPRPAISTKLLRNMNKSILPKLQQIGFDQRMAIDLFRLSSNSWENLNPYLDGQVSFHPKMVSDIETIYHDLHHQPGDKSGPESGSAEYQLNGKEDDIERFMGPEHLKDLLDRVSTPWIILPRAYNGLQKDQCRYLPLYLNFCEKNGDVNGNRIFTRMVIELVANYSEKFTDQSRSLILMKNAVFHAYEAMFWRNLRCPPCGFEDCQIFDTLFSFLKRHARKWGPTSPAMTKAVARMQTARRQLFPRLQYAPALFSASRFLVTLRHGYREVEVLMRYFENLPSLYRSNNSQQPVDLHLVNATNELTVEVRRKYRHENGHTRQNVRFFFDRLRHFIAGRTVLKSTRGNSPVDSCTFSKLKVVRSLEALDIELATLAV